MATCEEKLEAIRELTDKVRHPFDGFKTTEGSLYDRLDDPGYISQSDHADDLLDYLREVAEILES